MAPTVDDRFLFYFFPSSADKMKVSKQSKTRLTSWACGTPSLTLSRCCFICCLWVIQLDFLYYTGIWCLNVLGVSGCRKWHLTLVMSTVARDGALSNINITRHRSNRTCRSKTISQALNINAVIHVFLFPYQWQTDVGSNILPKQRCVLLTNCFIFSVPGALHVNITVKRSLAYFLPDTGTLRVKFDSIL